MDPHLHKKRAVAIMEGWAAKEAHNVIFLEPGHYETIMLDDLIQVQRIQKFCLSQVTMNQSARCLNVTY